MRRFLIPFMSVLLVALVSPAPVCSEPETAVVRRMPFGDVVKAKGKFAPADTYAIKTDLRAYKGTLEIEEIAEFGTVSEGQVLIRFKREAYAKALERMEIDVRLAQLKFELQERSFGRQKVSGELKRIESERRYVRAKDDFAFFHEADEKMRFEERESGMQSRRERLENQRDEFSQLEKMYGADDLTEETEEIVLKRARRSLKRSSKSMKFSERRHVRWLKRLQGRDREDREVKLEHARLAFEKVRDSGEAEMEQAFLSLKKARLGLRDAAKKLEDLRADEARLVIKSPVQGVLHPGDWSGGWKGYESMREQLEPGEKVKPGQALMTVIPEGPLHVTTTVDEKDILDVRAGLGAGVVPVADQSTTLRAQVLRVSPVSKGGKFTVTLAVAAQDGRLFPGMACEVAILSGSGSAALVVPACAVADRGGQTVVYVLEGGKPVPVAVVPGQAKAGWVSIAKGLKPGMRIVCDPVAK